MSITRAQVGHWMKGAFMDGERLERERAANPVKDRRP